MDGSDALFSTSLLLGGFGTKVLGIFLNGGPYGSRERETAPIYIVEDSRSDLLSPLSPPLGGGEEVMAEMQIRTFILTLDLGSRYLSALRMSLESYNNT